MYHEHGKPALAQPTDLRFNLSHSASLILIGVTVGQEIGVDIEQIRHVAEIDRIAADYLPLEHGAGIWLLDGVAKQLAFFSAWTRQEALLKAAGVGFSGLTATDSHSFTIETIYPADGYIGALALSNPGAAGPLISRRLS